jgi:hypothetical protein
MSTTEMSDMEREDEKLKLKQIAGKPQHIDINERSLEATRAEFRKKGMEISKQEEYDQEHYYLVKKLKQFDSLVDPTQGIKKVIESMVRQPITVFNKQGKAEVKDALYYNGNYYGVDKRGNDLGAEFQEGYFKKPRLVFSYVDPAHPYDSTTGEKRGTYKASGVRYEYYIFLPEKKEDRIKFLNDIVEKAIGTSIGNLSTGSHLSFRNPAPNNDQSGSHGGSFSWKIFCELSLEELGELQNKNYYTEKSTGQIKDRSGQRVAYDHGSGKVEPTKDR